jgi:uncharacterized protein (TIGR02246 family)
MIRLSLAAGAIAAMLALGACAQPQAPAANAPEDIAAVNALRDSFLKAFNAGDAEAIANLYTANGVSQHNHEQTATGHDAILASQKAMFDQMTVVAEIMPDETKTLGSIGFDRGRYKMTLTPKAGGQPMTDEGRYVVLLEKQADGSWKVTSDIDNSIMPMPMPPAAPAAAEGQK